MASDVIPVPVTAFVPIVLVQLTDLMGPEKLGSAFMNVSRARSPLDAQRSPFGLRFEPSGLGVKFSRLRRLPIVLTPVLLSVQTSSQITSFFVGFFFNSLV